MYKDCSGHLASTLYVLILHIAQYFTPEDIQVKVEKKFCHKVKEYIANDARY